MLSGVSTKPKPVFSIVREFCNSERFKNANFAVLLGYVQASSQFEKEKHAYCVILFA